MEGMSGWILSIAGVCLLSVMIDLILPEGKTTSAIKNVFSYIIVLVIIAPLPKLVGKKIDLSNIWNKTEIVLQDNFLETVNRTKLDKIEKQIEDDLKAKKIENVQVFLSANVFSSNMEIETVFVDLFNLPQTDKNQTKTIKQEIFLSIKKYVFIGEEKIIFNE
ncbi:MAG: hypothetical protein RR140_00720 [Clostridia bacterium]